MTDPYDLQRFVDAQAAVYPQVLAELRGGRKQSHWMWFIFPQVEGLGHSAMAQRYAIASRAEAAAYLRNGVLGPRLRECTALVNAIDGKSITDILGRPDDLKFRSSMTLFAHVTDDNREFVDAIRIHFDGAYDPATMAWLDVATGRGD